MDQNNGKLPARCGNSKRYEPKTQVNKPWIGLNNLKNRPKRPAEKKEFTFS
jgi:hypothetical protein